MSITKKALALDIRGQTVRRIENDRERDPFSGYAALADGVIQYLQILAEERSWRGEPPTDNESRLRAIVGWPDVQD